ncbi:hypothetical protein RFI_12922 [Reticulomyxa filosa]|uniref:Uncharacterized protein n=1 Tax=Reticulomyxa filosa TaxID=46433 RepID=X6NEB5_RETFI|nr:hypothetical protein RFI_12922 [Reticulomyxa filosa]|eukprot:ETO24233.1 hypothetical protein RFI_12922 [Reticulomyxa filosa]
MTQEPEKKAEEKEIVTIAVKRRGSVSKEKVKPATWEEILGCRNPKTYKSLPREDNVALEYQVLMSHLHETYHSVKDFILIKKLGSQAKLMQLLRNFSIPLELFMPNDFPYYIDPEIFHYVLWNRKTECVTNDKDELTKSVEKYIIREIKTKEILDWKYKTDKDKEKICAENDFEFFWRGICIVWSLKFFVIYFHYYHCLQKRVGTYVLLSHVAMKLNIFFQLKTFQSCFMQLESSESKKNIWSMKKAFYKKTLKQEQNRGDYKLTFVKMEKHNFLLILTCFMFCHEVKKGPEN